MNELYLSGIMLFLGLVSHFLTLLMQVKKDRGVIISPVQYWWDNPYYTTFTIVSAIVGFITLMSIDELSPITAFGLGFIAEKIPETLGSRSIDKIKR